MIRSLLFLFLLCISATMALLPGQTTVLPNTSVLITPATKLIFPDGSDLQLGANVDFANDGTIEFHGTSSIAETIAFPIYGNGIEQSLSFQGSAPSSLNIAGLGLSVTNSIASDSLIVTRGHTAQTDNNGNSSVLRWFEVNADNWSTGGEVRMVYEPAFTNGLDETLLNMAYAPMLNATWQLLNASNTSNAVTVSTDSLGFFTLFEDPFLSLNENAVPLNAMSVFPNPTNGIAVVQTSDKTNKISIFNMAGQLMQETNTNQEKTFILDISYLPSGLYEIRSSDGLATRIMKE